MNVFDAIKNRRAIKHYEVDLEELASMDHFGNHSVTGEVDD